MVSIRGAWLQITSLSIFHIYMKTTGRIKQFYYYTAIIYVINVKAAHTIIDDFLS